MNKIGIIASREFRERVRKKSFIITTILMPILVIALAAAPTLMMLHGTSDVKHVVVVDETEGSFVGNALESNSSMEFQLLDGMTRKDAISEYGSEDKAFGILWIGADIMEYPTHVQLINNSSSSIMIEEELSGQLSNILRTAKLQSYNIEGIDQIIEDSKLRVSLTTMKNNGSGEEDMEETSTDFSMIVSLLLGMMLYMFIIIYGQQVLTTVIEEKQSRVLDVMVTSCPPFDLMMGKILGIAAVAAVQIAIWAIIIIGASQLLVPLIPVEAAAEAGSMATVLTTTFGDVSYILTIFLYLLLYIIGGFLLYASLYAAAGSSVDSVQDAQQFNTILMLPIIVSLIVMMSVFNDPNSNMIFWFSMIPFTSPVVMMARIPFDIPTWQVVVSIVILYASFVLTTWIAARIYRIGIFMHGAKPTWKDLGRWLRTK